MPGKAAAGLPVLGLRAGSGAGTEAECRRGKSGGLELEGAPLCRAPVNPNQAYPLGSSGRLRAGEAAAMEPGGDKLSRVASGQAADQSLPPLSQSNQSEGSWLRGGNRGNKCV